MVADLGLRPVVEVGGVHAHRHALHDDDGLRDVPPQHGVELLVGRGPGGGDGRARGGEPVGVPAGAAELPECEQLAATR